MIESNKPDIDPAAVLGAAVSLWHACQQPRGDFGRIDLSESYGGVDQWMREVMRIAGLFESWATQHVCFEKLAECWPYFLEGRFGGACVELVGAGGLASFDERDCLRVALRLRLPVVCSDALIVPLCVEAENPIAGSVFRRLRIQTVRCAAGGDFVGPMTMDDDPFAEEFGPPFFALYGVEVDGRLEHIADRRSYAEARELALKLAPGIAFLEEAVTMHGEV